MVVLPATSAQRGTTMIEVLVTIVILTIGLLGMAGLQARLQVSEMESYQRTQALILLEDMANRITTNRSAASTYVTGSSSLGVGMTCPTATTTSTVQQVDASEWCNALQGAAEATGGNKVGAMIGARGCIEEEVTNEYMVTVAWQGMTPISAPPASVTCGQGSYNGGVCTDDRCRRAITTVVRIGTL